MKFARRLPMWSLALTVIVMVLGCSHPDAARVVVSGGDGGGIARAQPVEERFDPVALDQATKDSTAAGLQAFVVLRHEHIVFERYGHGVDARSELDLGGFARVLAALAAGSATRDDLFPLSARSAFDPAQLINAIETGSHQSYADYLSINLWRRLNAAPAWIALDKQGATIPADCCFHAQLMDWMRVADLLVGEGHFEGKQLLAPEWIMRMRRPSSADGRQGFGVELAPSAHGAEGFEADDVFFVRGPGHWRLWVVPSLQLAVLFGAQTRQTVENAPAWDETRLPNLVMRALADRPKTGEHASKLQQLVPGH